MAVQKAFPLVLHTTKGLCIVRDKRADSAYAGVFDRTEDRGGRKAPFEAGLSHLSSSEPIQNFNLTNIAYFSQKQRSLQTTIQFTPFT